MQGVGNRILVTGATGTVGKLVVPRLLERGATVRVLTRDAQKGRQIFGDKVEFATGDVSEKEWISRAEIFDSVDRLFLLTISRPDQPVIEQEIAAAAKQAGVKQIVKVSVQGASTAEPSNSLMRWHAFAEEAVIGHGPASYVILRPNLFLQNFSRDDAPSIKTDGKFYKPGGNCRISHVDVRDIADVAAVVLTDPIEKHSGNTYYISGPESLTYDEVAERIGKVLNKRVEYVNLDDYAAYTTWKSYNLPDVVAHMLVKLFQFYRTNGAAEAFLDSKIVTGNEPRSVEQFFADHKELFS